jgi:hypothetical protein
MESFHRDVRHFIYTHFAETTVAPTTAQVSEHFKVSIAAVERAFEGLANAHHSPLVQRRTSINGSCENK